MKKLFLAILILAIPAIVVASPFVICNPQTGVTEYQVTIGGEMDTVSAQTDGSIRMDVSGADEGLNSLIIKACRNDEVWGLLCSDPVPFDFTRPSVPDSPSGIGLTP